MEFEKYTLDEVGEIVSGATPKTSDESNFGGDIAWITPADLSGYTEKYISHGVRNLTQKGYESCSTRLMPKGTVLFTSRAPIGYVAIAANEICTNQGFKSIIPNHDIIDSEFLYYQLIFLRNEIQNKGTGTTFKEVSSQKMKEVIVRVPSLEDQRKIVSRIEELFCQLDASEVALCTVKNQLAVYRQAVLQNGFYPEKQHIVEMGQIVDDVRIGPFGTMLHKEDYISNGIPVINPQHIKNLCIKESPNITISVTKAEELSPYRLNQNDVIMGRRGEMGRSAAITERENGWICGTGSILFRLKSEFDAMLYAQILSSPRVVRYLDDHATGSTMKNLNESIVRRIPVPYIDKSMQKKMDETIAQQLSISEEIKSNVNFAMLQSKALHQSILQHAFEGLL